MAFFKTINYSLSNHHPTPKLCIVQQRQLCGFFCFIWITFSSLVYSQQHSVVCFLTLWFSPPLSPPPPPLSPPSPPPLSPPSPPPHFPVYSTTDRSQVMFKCTSMSSEDGWWIKLYSSNAHRSSTTALCTLLHKIYKGTCRNIDLLRDLAVTKARQMSTLQFWKSTFRLSKIRGWLLPSTWGMNHRNFKIYFLPPNTWTACVRDNAAESVTNIPPWLDYTVPTAPIVRAVGIVKLQLASLSLSLSQPVIESLSSAGR